MTVSRLLRVMERAAKGGLVHAETTAGDYWSMRGEAARQALQKRDAALAAYRASLCVAPAPCHPDGCGACSRYQPRGYLARPRPARPGAKTSL